MYIMEENYGTKESDHRRGDLEAAFEFLFSNCNLNIFSAGI